MAIPNKYKDILEDFIDSSDIEPLNMPRPVNKGPRNIMPGSKNPSTEPELEKNISDRSQQQQWHCGVPIARCFVRRQYHDTQIPGPKRDRKVQEKKSIEGRQKGGVEQVV